MYQEQVDKYNIQSLRSGTTQQPWTPNITSHTKTLRILAASFVTYLFIASLCFAQASGAADSLSVLFLGDRGSHRPSERARQIIPFMKMRGIDITYTGNLSDLNTANLANYEVLIIYCDSYKIEMAQEKALLDFVANGGGLVAIHCASYCFPESPKYVALLGAQFMYHSTGKFRTRVINADHPIMKNFQEFETEDETYVHTKHNQDLTVLQVRSEGDRDEPYTWVRTHGKGRVFYTAYGHDDRTWGNPAFQSLMERGIQWASGSDSIVNDTLKTDL